MSSNWWDPYTQSKKTTTAAARSITAPSSWEGTQAGASVQGGFNESQALEAAMAYANAHPGYSPVRVMKEGQIFYQNGKPYVDVKFNTGLGSSTELVPLEGYAGGSIEGGGGGGGGGAGGAGGGSGIPGAGIYRQYQAEAKRAYDTALARIRQQRGTLMQQYGFTADIDAQTGMHSNVRLDPYNQFGTVRTMLARQGLSLDDVRNQAIGRHISGGLARQGERNLRFLHGAESQALGSQFSQQLEGLLGQQQDAESAYRKALLDAELEALRSALANQRFRVGGVSEGSSSGSSGGFTINPQVMTDPEGVDAEWANEAAASFGPGYVAMVLEGIANANSAKGDRDNKRFGNIT